VKTKIKFTQLTVRRRH